MGKVTLIVGKEMPEFSDFAEGILHSDRNVIATGLNIEEDESVKRTIAERKAQMSSYEESKDIESKSGICTFEWNKSSAISTRSLILQGEKYFSSLDEVVLFFDEEYISSLAGKMDAEEVSKNSDNYFTSFQNVALEVLARFEKKFSNSNPATLVFMLKECPCVADVVRVPSIKNGSLPIASPLVASSAAAFTAFAENIAALYGDLPFVNIVLVRFDSSKENYTSEQDLGQWLASYLDSLSQMKNKLSAKKSMQWVKPGSKNSSNSLGFLFKK
jgi:hypothetical protein